MAESVAVGPIGYWAECWQVPVCAIVVAAPAAAAAALIFRSESDPVRASDLWKPCWRRLHPRWLLAYRAVACVAMSYPLISMLLDRGPKMFYFYTQWTFALVNIYFVIATLVSVHGCWMHSRRHSNENEQVVRRLLERDFEANLPEILTSGTHDIGSGIKLHNYHELGENEEVAGFWGHAMQIIYQASAGAVFLTDLTFWGLLVPFASPEYLNLNPVSIPFLDRSRKVVLSYTQRCVSSPRYCPQQTAISFFPDGVFCSVDFFLCDIPVDPACMRPSMVAIPFPRSVYSLGAFVVSIVGVASHPLLWHLQFDRESKELNL